MRISQIKSDLEEVALANGISEFSMNWINTINDESNRQYDFMILMPPKRVRAVNDNNPDRRWELSFYIFRKNATSTGEDNSIDERNTAWDELEVVADTIIDAFSSRSRQITKFGFISYKEFSDFELTFDEGLSNDGDVCVKGTIRITTENDC